MATRAIITPDASPPTRWVGIREDGVVAAARTPALVASALVAASAGAGAWLPECALLHAAIVAESESTAVPRSTVAWSLAGEIADDALTILGGIRGWRGLPSEDPADVAEYAALLSTAEGAVVDRVVTVSTTTR